MKAGTLSKSKECTTCDNCGGDVTIPPGVYYEGEPHHRQCAKRLRKLDYTQDVLDPRKDLISDELEETLDV